MSFKSILFKDTASRASDKSAAALQLFADTNFDQIIAAITTGKEEYDLTPFFHLPLCDAEAVAFRHEVMQDLEVPAVLDIIRGLALRMRAVRAHLAEAAKAHYELQKQRWFLDAVEIYTDAVTRLANDMSGVELRSRGFLSFRRYITDYATSAGFISLTEQTKRLEAQLAAIRYSIYVRGSRVEVRHYTNEPDFSGEVQATFERFQQGGSSEYSFKFGTALDMDHIETQILAGVAHLHQDIFSELREFTALHKDCFEETLRRFDREIQFYVSYLEYEEKFKEVGLNFCYPRITNPGKGVFNEEGFDLALAGKLLGSGRKPVCNDYYLKGSERIIVVSGPNQGGKTTFARAFGQQVYLTSLGYKVPGTRAQFHLPDQIFTRFEKEEKVANLRGKLEDDLVRVHEILRAATPRSIIIINEIFGSTSLRDAIALSRKIAAKIMELDVACVWVTFLDELSSLSEKTLSMMSTVVPENPAERTFKIVRRPADGLAYAMSIAEKYRLTHDLIKERIRP